MVKEEFMYPELLHARSYHSIDYSIKNYPEREAEFFEISIYIEDNGTLYLNGTEHRIQRGDVRFTRPGDILRTDIPFHALSMVLRFGQDNTAYNHNFIDRIPSFFHCDEETIHMFESIIQLNSSMSTGDKILMNAHVLQLLHHLYTFINQKRPIPQAIQMCLDYIKEHYDQVITLNNLGEITGYAPLHVHRLFKEYVGQTPCEYLQTLRMLHARNLLDTTTLSVCEITNAVGFRSLSSFQALFKKSFGISPGKYRKRSEI